MAKFHTIDYGSLGEHEFWEDGIILLAGMDSALERGVLRRVCAQCEAFERSPDAEARRNQDEDAIRIREGKSPVCDDGGRPQRPMIGGICAETCCGCLFSFVDGGGRDYDHSEHVERFVRRMARRAGDVVKKVWKRCKFCGASIVVLDGQKCPVCSR